MRKAILAFSTIGKKQRHFSMMTSSASNVELASTMALANVAGNRGTIDLTSGSDTVQGESLANKSPSSIDLKVLRDRDKILATMQSLIEQGAGIPHQRAEVAALSNLSPAEVSCAFKSRIDMIDAIRHWRGPDSLAR